MWITKINDNANNADNSANVATVIENAPETLGMRA